MKKSRVKLDKKGLSDQQILNHKNFDQAFQAFQNGAGATAGASQGVSGLLKALVQSTNFWIGGGITAILATVATVAVLYNSNNESVGASNNQDSQAGDTVVTHVSSQEHFVRPPLDNVGIAWESFSVNANEDSQINTSTGSTISIPCNVFMKLDGSVVDEGDVEIKYREYHTVVDIFLSGIPMTYDTNGVEHTFESAGMLEIEAFQDGEKLEIQENKSINIDMISYNDDPYFNLYYLNQEEQRWECKGKDEINKITVQNDGDANSSELVYTVENKESNLNNEAGRTDNQLNMQQSKMNVEPVKPRKAGKDTYLFDIDIDMVQRPEFAEYKNVVFEVDESTQKFDPKLYDITWHDANISKSSRAGLYTLTLSRMDTTVELTVYPVWNEENYDKAQQQYLDMTRQLEKEKKERNSNQKKHQDGRAELTKRLMNEYIRYVNHNPESTRNFEVSDLGIWNCDHPENNPGKTFSPDFVDNNSQTVEYDYIYVADNKTNILRSYRSSSLVLPSNDCKVWLVTKDGQIAIVQEESLEGLSKNEINTITVDLYNELDGIKALNEEFGTKQDTEQIEEQPVIMPEDDEQKISIRAYPNPFHEVVYIKSNKEDSYLVQLISVSGAIVKEISFTGNKFEWRPSTVKSGTYFLRITNKDQTVAESIRLIRN